MEKRIKELEAIEKDYGIIMDKLNYLSRKAKELQEEIKQFR